MRIIQASDLHQDVSKLETIANTAKTQSLNFVFAGDWFDCHSAVEKQAEQRGIEKDAVGENEEAQEEIKKKAKEAYQTFNTTISGVKTYAIPGNHDFKSMYDTVTNAHFLNKESATINGVKFAGAINSYEVPKGINPDNLVDLADDISDQELMMFFQQQGIDPRTLKKEEITKLIEEMSEQSPTYQRLKNEDLDYLVAHKGPTGSLTNKNPSGIGTGRLVKEKKPNVLCGHFHSGLVVGGEITGLRSAPDTFYIIEINEEDKKIDWVDTYEFEDAA